MVQYQTEVTRYWSANGTQLEHCGNAAHSEQERIPLRMRSRVPLSGTHDRVERSTFTEHSCEKNIAEVISIGYNFQRMFRAFQLADILTEETKEQFITKLK